jgi:hypothetical protein
MFETFSSAVHAQYNELAKHELYIVDTLDIFASYLSFFPEGTNPIFRERTEHDCNCCKNFIRRLGTLIAIVDGEIKTVWDAHANLPHPYDIVGRKMAELVRQAPIVTVFRTKEHQYGAERTPDSHENRMWNHFHGRVASKHNSHQPDTARGTVEASVHVFKRGMEELTRAAFDQVIELIEANALYRGGEFLSSVKGLQTLKIAYDAADNKTLFLWSNYDQPAARARNTAIGTLLIDLSEGTELNKAVAMFEAKVAPTNYKRTTAVITPKMIEQAVDKLKELGLEGAVHRRYATIADVSVNNVLFVDNSVQHQMKDGLTELLMTGAKAPKVDVKAAVTISIADFIETVLPSATSIHALVQNRHQGNFMSLTGGDGPERLFKWNNNFAWSYDGEVADSIKQRVKRAGGNVEAKLRVSLGWFNYDDLDIHAVCPDGHVYFGNKLRILDVDMNAGGARSRQPVENLAWQRPKDGRYEIKVNQYAKRESVDVGFTLELETNGRLEQFSYNQALAGGSTVTALTFDVVNGAVTNLKVGPKLVGGSVSVDKWGLKTETLVPVETMLLSPNHWDGQAIGNRHWFFILKDCRNPDAVRGIYNEFLRSDLDQHRKVFEVLGSKTKCPASTNQLSGVGFSSGRGDEVTVVVNKRAYNIQF